MSFKINLPALIALLAKLGPKVLSVFTKLFKGVKIGKGGLAAASFGSYAYMLTWEFALIIMFALFVHESGHVWAMKKCGIKTKGFYFIPFIGGAAVAEEDFPSRNAETYIALMGPIWGIVSALIVALLYFITSNPLFAAGASWIALVNLFNLLPINPLDGGRVFKSLAYSISSILALIFLLVGITACGIIAFKFDLYIFLLLGIVGTLELIAGYRKRHKMPNMTAKTILYAVAAYLLIAFICWTIMTKMKLIPGADLAMELLIG